MSRLLDTVLDPARGDRPALTADANGAGARSYGELRQRCLGLAARLTAERPLGGAAVAFLYPPGPAYVEALLGVMAAGGLAVPLSPLHTPPELAALLADARPVRILCHPDLRARLPDAESLEVTADPAAGAAPAPSAPPAIPDGADALMLFTSGTTGRPKGVVSSHAALAACTECLQQAWGWRPDDRLLHVLPLHHTHGVVVALLGALWAGARVRFAAPLAPQIWELFGDASVFMAVPSLYARLLETFDGASTDQRTAWRRGAAGLRLATSGSAALPAPLFEAVAAATGQQLLERYGMTEIGMALGNPLAGPRLPGTVGRELPGVEVEIVDEHDRPCAVGQPGELRVRSPQMFSRYHGDPEATARAFDGRGRFRTGDTGQREPSGWVRLLGRSSVDILKSGGYKLSALEIEAALADHPAIAELAIIGQPDPTWGDRVTACVVLRPGATLTLDELQAFARDRLAPYKWPRTLHLLPELPRNAMGKVQKARLR